MSVPQSAAQVPFLNPISFFLVCTLPSFKPTGKTHEIRFKVDLMMNRSLFFFFSFPAAPSRSESYSSSFVHNGAHTRHVGYRGLAAGVHPSQTRKTRTRCTRDAASLNAILVANSPCTMYWHARPLRLTSDINLPIRLDERTDAAGPVDQ